MRIVHWSMNVCVGVDAHRALEYEYVCGTVGVL